MRQVRQVGQVGQVGQVRQVGQVGQVRLERAAQSGGKATMERLKQRVAPQRRGRARCGQAYLLQCLAATQPSKDEDGG